MMVGGYALFFVVGLGFVNAPCLVNPCRAPCDPTRAK